MRPAVSYIRVSKPKQGRSGLGLVPPPGKPDSQPIGRQRLYHRSRSPPRMTEPV
jgi:hypothetical protein